ncbi:nitroreductase family protein [Planococcus lenghuensis]|uniref:Putative NAD(P)H nitroreductase n=1 Tax=Planococcus lenghuensis TaxID=2213202 RepID=A0A1Q2L303_9BACL|nr:nitroreductase [Planococcus lenghuensis]AQQ54793.1 nitroreductase [Planococcus lenghuensis]
MDVSQAIKNRRSNGLVTDEPVPEDVIKQVLEAGTWAPSHHRTEPWRFFVLTGSGRKPLGETLAKIQAGKMDDPESETNQKKLEATKQKPYRAPVVIVAAVEPSDNPKAIEKEEHGAVYAAIQNMLLAAHELGLGTFWRTGAPAYDPQMRDLFGLSDRGEVLGFIYLGYPKKEVPEGKRVPVEEVTKWFADEKDFNANK